PRAKVFACTSGGCTDITSLVTIDTNRNSITVRIEDGGIMDEDGQINGEINTKDFVYAVIPEEYRKSGGCAMGGGADYGLVSLLLISLLALLRRLGFKTLLIVVFFSLPTYASMEQVQKHMKEGEYEEALSVLDGVIKERGLSEERVLLKSYLLLKLGQPKEAVSFVEESMKFLPSDRLRLRLAYLYGITGDFSKAWSALRQVKKKDQDYHFVEGFLHLREGNLTKAKFGLSRVTPSSENYQEAQLYLAQVHLAEEDYHRFGRAIGRISKDSEFYNTAKDMESSFKERKKLSFNLALGAEYDTNLLGVFDLETKIKTWKYFTSVSANYSGESLRGFVRAYLSSNDKGSSFNLNFYSLELEPKVGNFSLPFRFDHITLGGDFYASIGQVGLSYRSLYGTPYMMVGYQDYLSQAFSFENRDGYFLTAGYRYEHLTRKFYGNMDFYARSTNTKGSNWDSNAGGARFFGSYSINNRLSAGLNLSLEGVKYTKENQAFLKKRRDLFLSATPFLSLNLYRNFGLVVSYSHARNLSSINFYSYRRNLYTLQLTGRF
ncbi:MAG: hypothetical protein N2648_01065, partial [Aquificaceae bacterium]|nr:hypothetical protein [Aquificaceae bacterium]